MTMIRVHFIQMAGAVALAFLLAGCISAPPPKYQPGIDNTEALLHGGHSALGVGAFDAAHDVNNTSLSVRGSTLTGGSDGTFSTYLSEALTTELKTAGRYATDSDKVISGTLTENRLDGGIKIGTADVGAHFVVTDKGDIVYDKTLAAHEEWKSSFMGAVAIPAAMRNYAAAVQKLLKKLFSDPDFAIATQHPQVASH